MSKSTKKTATVVSLTDQLREQAETSVATLTESREKLSAALIEQQSAVSGTEAKIESVDNERASIQASIDLMLGKTAAAPKAARKPRSARTKSAGVSGTGRMKGKVVAVILKALADTSKGEPMKQSVMCETILAMPEFTLNGKPVNYEGQATTDGKPKTSANKRTKEYGDLYRTIQPKVPTMGPDGSGLLGWNAESHVFITAAGKKALTAIEKSA